MNRKESRLALLILGALFLWSGLVLSAFYIAQRPLVFQVARGIGATLWSITLLAMMLITSAGLGGWLLNRLLPAANPGDRLILGTGIGLGILGFAGYGLAAAGMARPRVLAILLAAGLGWTAASRMRNQLRQDLKACAEGPDWRMSGVPAWIKLAVSCVLAMTFLFALLPPAEGFDGLLYHLALPERLLAERGVFPNKVLQFWFPSLIEGDFVWALALGSERTAQLIHWSFLLLTSGMLWEWSRRAFGGRAAWWALLILVSMPSLPLVSSWAYTDMALAFFVLACLYSLWCWSETARGSWLVVSGILAGMAMGIKYTSFTLPLLCLLLILSWENGARSKITSGFKFACTALIIAAPWYLRNWLVMGNPFYPFLFKGLYWDSFRSAWYAGSGTGIGWNVPELFLLPFKVMMGINDQNYFDGRMGPLFLLLLPLAAWAAWSVRSGTTGGRRAMLLAGLFGAVSIAAWTLGVIQTAHLWQARLLWPGLIPLTIPMGLSLARLPELDLPRLRTSFILTVLTAIVVTITLVDNSLSLVFRRPLGVALGMESRQAYFERMQPRYAAALELVASTPPGSYIYLMFEPRSYGMPRRVQADPINDNLMHDFYLYRNVEGVVKAWRSEGFTHILIYLPGKLQASDPAFDQMLPYLRLEAEKADYRLYSLSQ